MPCYPARQTSRIQMHTILSTTLQALRHSLTLAICCVAVLPSASIQAANSWIDISSPLLDRITNNGAKAAWPGGCSGVVVNRTNADVTIKVVGFGLWRSS